MKYGTIVGILVLCMVIHGMPKTSFAGGIGLSGCKSAEKIAKCTAFAASEIVDCHVQDLLNKRPSHACLGGLCAAAYTGCCACMKHSDICEEAKDMTPENVEACCTALAEWIISHTPRGLE